MSGNLRLSDMVMYDRQTETWWQQAPGLGIVGELTGTKLEPLNHGDHFWFAWAAFVPETDISTTDGLIEHGGRS